MGLLAMKSTFVDSDKAVPKVLNQFLARFKLPVNGSVDLRVKRLFTYFQGHIPEAHLFQCNTCLGTTDGRLAVCGYCGTTIPMHEKVVSKMYTLNVSENEPPIKIHPITLESELDIALARIEMLRKESSRNNWEIAIIIFNLFRMDAYLIRTKPDGSPRYNSWNEFCYELKCSPSTSYRMMNLVVHYTVEELTDISTSKLKAALVVPEKIRTEFLVKNADSTITEIVRKVKAMDLPIERKITGRRPNGGGKPVKKNSVVEIDFEAHTQTAFARPKKMNSSESARHAKDIYDDPYVRFKLNGHTLLIRVERNPDGAIDITYQFEPAV